MTIRRLSYLVALTGLLLVLTACTKSPSLQAEHTPTVNTSTTTPTATVAPSPTPFGGTSARLGPLPHTCSLSAIRTPKTISSQFAQAVGTGPAWGVGIISYHQVPLALVWGPNDALDTHEKSGWGHKLLWVAATTLQGSVTIRGINLSTGDPLYPEAEYAAAASTPTTLVLDPSDPTVVNQDANRNDQWTQFPGGLTIPSAGCYSLEAVWSGGSWQMTFAAGVVPG